MLLNHARLWRVANTTLGFVLCCSWSQGAALGPEQVRVAGLHKLKFPISNGTQDFGRYQV